MCVDKKQNNMTPEEIIEYNKRCAEFLGLNRDNEVVVFNMRGYSYYNLKFHSDWNWIHEVIENIKNTTNPKEHSDTTFSTLRREIQTNLGRSNKEAAVQAILNFLIWYDKNK